MHGPSSPQARFLLRGSVLLIVSMLLWWWVLVAPLAAGLRIAADLTVHLFPGSGPASGVTEDSAGNWMVQTPVPAWLAQTAAAKQMFGAEQGQAVRVRSLRLAIAPDVPQLFLVAFPVFWTVALAAPWNKRTWRILLIGTGLIFVQAWLAVIIYSLSKINETLQAFSSTGATILGYLEYLNMYVAPYMAPILLAVGLNEDLRTRILMGEEDPASAEPEVKPVEEPKGRGQHKKDGPKAGRAGQN